VIQTCEQCGAVNGAEARVCCFCDARLSSKNPEDNFVRASLMGAEVCAADACADDDSPAEADDNRARSPEWRNEVTHRVAAYRARGRRLRTRSTQPEFRFDSAASGETGVTQKEARVRNSSAAAARPVPTPRIPAGHSSVTPAPRRQRKWEDHLEIDVAQPMLNFSSVDYYPARLEPTQLVSESDKPCSAAAPLHERARAATIDAAFLLFAYGGFLALFLSLGGRLTVSTLHGAVIVTAIMAASLGLLYAQYCLLFAIFGGATPGMMVRGLGVVNFDGSEPATRQLLWRSAGYLASAGIGCLGFLWALWDRDHLTWHDRISHTYITFR
jgi:uncharacterized RDD family membrane protein YckC